MIRHTNRKSTLEWRISRLEKSLRKYEDFVESDRVADINGDIGIVIAVGSAKDLFKLYRKRLCDSNIDQLMENPGWVSADNCVIIQYDDPGFAMDGGDCALLIDPESDLDPIDY